MTLETAINKIRKINTLLGVGQCCKDVEETALLLFDGEGVPEKALADWAWAQIESLIEQ